MWHISQDFLASWFAYENLLFLLQGSESRGSRNTDFDEERSSESRNIKDNVKLFK